MEKCTWLAGGLILKVVMHDDIMPAGGQCCESFDDVASGDV